MKNRKRLIYIFLANYILTIAILAIAIVVFVGSLVFQAYWQLKDNTQLMTKKSVILKDTYKEIDKAVVLKNGGWIETVDNNKVKEVLGTKEDKLWEYDLQKIINDKESINKYEIKAYKENVGNKQFLYIVKIPTNRFDSEFESLLSNLQRMLFNSLIVSLLFIIVAISIMAYISILIVRKPLKKIWHGITEMSTGNYEVKLNFTTYKEIDEIKNAFNSMSEKLQKSEAEKKISEESKQQMIRSISHDIKTPITSILGYSKILMEENIENEGEKKKYLGYIYNKTLRLNYLVDGLFSFAKLDSINYTLNKKEEDFAEFLREVIALYYGEIEEKKFDIVTDIPEETVHVSFDSKEMERALGNVIVNAIKYNPPNTELSFSLLEEESKIIVCIEDNGIGMETDIVTSVFGEFIRGDKSRGTEGGSGLGLANTKKVIDMHGGEISLQSEDRKGSKFNILLPKN
jgi:signal transduction histidine kinase